VVEEKQEKTRKIERLFILNDIQSIYKTIIYSISNALLLLIITYSNMTALVEMVDLGDNFMISREEIDGLALIFAESKKSNPIKVTYDNICIREFHTCMKTNPRPVFNDILDSTAKKIKEVIAEFKDKDSTKIVGTDSWQIKTKYLTLDLCLHCYSEYDMSDFVFEDTAIHRVVVSVVTYFDTKYMYRLDKSNEEVFRSINQFYVDLKIALTH
jgi:hypothetical protein